MRKSFDYPNIPLVEERFWNAIKNGYRIQYGRLPEFVAYVFPQVWGSTSLGFSGIGGQAMTEAYTTVIIDRVSDQAGVFFNERLAYIVTNPNKRFYEDLGNFDIKSVGETDVYSD